MRLLIHENILQRHFGIEQIKNIKKLMDLEKGTLVEISDQHTDSLIWCKQTPEGWQHYLSSTEAEEYLKSVLCSEKVTITRLATDATNIHYLVQADRANYYIKEYTRWYRGSNEYLFGRALKQMFPEIIYTLSVQIKGKQHTVFTLFKKLLDAENLDRIVGRLLLHYSHEQQEKFLQYVLQATHAIQQLHEQLNSVGEQSNLETLYERVTPFFKQVRTYLQKWIHEHGKELQVNEEKRVALEKMLSTALQKTLNASEVIHGDIWWRQFEMQDSHLLVLDLEDVLLGSKLYDFCSHYSGILNQLDYFYMEENLNLENYNELRQAVQQQFSTYRAREGFREFYVCRMVSELAYAITHWNADVQLPIHPKLTKNNVTQHRYFLIDALIMRLLNEI